MRKNRIIMSEAQGKQPGPSNESQQKLEKVSVGHGEVAKVDTAEKSASNMHDDATYQGINQVTTH